MKPFRFFGASAFLFAAACASQSSTVVSETPDTTSDAPSPTPDSIATEVFATDAGDASQGVSDAAQSAFTAHFRAWLSANGYANDDFARDDLIGGSFGGKTTDGSVFAHDPVVFVHGNSDSAERVQSAKLSGFAASKSAFLAAGYGAHELYATSWGPANANLAQEQAHSREYVMRTRRFLEAVLAYTGASKIDVIAHSMGVTLARAAIRGGTLPDATLGSYDVGPSLSPKIDTFIGIAGANLGLSSCYFAPTLRTCNAVNGFYPGQLVNGAVVGLSELLRTLNEPMKKEGDFVATIFATTDEVIGGGGLVWGRLTSALSTQDRELRLTAPGTTHADAKDTTGAQQVTLVRDHK
jgi:triacylglycerol lipase